MFKYQSMYRQNAKGQALKVVSLSILSAIIISILMMIIMGLFSIPAFSFYDSPWILLYVVLGFFILFLLSIFLVYPMSIGILRYFTQAYNDESFGLGELFFSFKEGRYGKAVKVTVLIVIFYIIFSIALSFLGNIVYALVNLPFSAIPGISSSTESFEETWAAVSGQFGIIILMFILNLLITLLMYIPTLLAVVYIGLVYLSFVDQPLIPTMDKFKIAWDVMFKSGESVVRLLVSNILLSIGFFILFSICMFVGGLVGVSLDSPGMVFTLFIIGGILFLILYIYLLYIIVGSVVSYYYMGRSTLDKEVQEQANDEMSVPSE